MNRQGKWGKKLAGILAVAIGAFGGLNGSIAQADIEYISNRTMLISKTQWNNRSLTMEGVGKVQLTAYGQKREGKTIHIGFDGEHAFVDVYGGYYDTTETGEAVKVNGNTIDVINGGSGWLLYDDPAKRGDDTWNRTVISDTRNVNLPVNIIGGHSGIGEAAYNTINLRGGALNGYVIGAEAKNYTPDAAGLLHDNTVNIIASTDLVLAKLYGAALFNDTDRSRSSVWGTNNTLNVYVKDITVGELAAFNTYNFYLPSGTVSGDTMVTVAGGNAADISRSTINGIVARTGSLPIGSTVNLLVDDRGITDGQETVYRGIHADSGQALGDINGNMYELQVQKAALDKVTLQVAGTNKLYHQTKNLVQHKVPAFINRGADFLTGGAAESAQAAGAQVYTPFFAASHSSMRHTTGSHVDVRGCSMVLGLSRKLEKPDRQILIAPVVEYGKGRYNSYLDDGTHGWGNTSYWGLGLVCRTTCKDGNFYEASLRGGRLRSDYSSNDYIYNGQKSSEHFASTSAYYGAHFGLGREIGWQRRHKFTYYGKYFYTYNGPETYRLRNGQAYRTSSAQSHRLRLGVRDTYAINEKNKTYLGLAWEHEFAGSAYATCNGRRTEAPSIRGNSYMLEIGWVIKPYADDTLSFDISAAGWLGRQRGITGRLGINWLF